MSFRLRTLFLVLATAPMFVAGHAVAEPDTSRGPAAPVATEADARAQRMRQGAAGLGAPPPLAPAPGGAGKIERLGGNIWIEGPGYDITYGKDYEACAARCLSQMRCLMIEYYRPEKKCNLYDRRREPKRGGSSIVGLRGS